MRASLDENGSSFGKVDGKNPHKAHSPRSHGVAAVHERLSKLAKTAGAGTVYAGIPGPKAPKGDKKVATVPSPAAGSAAAQSAAMQNQVRSMESSTQGL